MVATDPAEPTAKAPRLAAVTTGKGLDHFVRLLDHSVGVGFLARQVREAIDVMDEVDQLVAALCDLAAAKSAAELATVM
jgi:hypothetical protein